MHELVPAAPAIPQQQPAGLGLEQLRLVGHALHLERERAVLRARMHGMTWAAIGGLLGISKQSAHERWSAMCDDLGGFELRLQDGKAFYWSPALDERIDPVNPDAARLAGDLHSVRVIDQDGNDA